ncbi:hypothetical protein M0804_001074 [Polistes exclamans]|nr:hypothetical protein M0804_001074 [Polistes exclamans]
MLSRKLSRTTFTAKGKDEEKGSNHFSLSRLISLLQLSSRQTIIAMRATNAVDSEASTCQLLQSKEQ